MANYLNDITITCYPSAIESILNRWKSCFNTEFCASDANKYTTAISEIEQVNHHYLGDVHIQRIHIQCETSVSSSDPLSTICSIFERVRSAVPNHVLHIECFYMSLHDQRLALYEWDWGNECYGEFNFPTTQRRVEKLRNSEPKLEWLLSQMERFVPTSKSAYVLVAKFSGDEEFRPLAVGDDPEELHELAYHGQWLTEKLRRVMISASIYEKFEENFRTSDIPRNTIWYVTNVELFGAPIKDK